MCGLYGFSGKYQADRTKIRWLAYANESRGRDSTGVFTIKNDKKATQSLVKDTSTSSKYILTDEFNNAIEGAVSILGHTRMGTKGIVSVDNAHPFEYDFGLPVVGAHNGFIPSQYLGRYLKEYDLTQEFDEHTMCDSQIIFAMLSKYDGDYNKLSELEGGITTLFMYPTKFNKTLFAYKREARSLHYGYAPEGIYISSESEPLFLIGCHNVQSFDDHSLTILKDGAIVDIASLTKPKIKISLGTTEKTWTTSASKSELDAYPETRNISKPSYVPIRTFGRGVEREELDFSSFDTKRIKSVTDDDNEDKFRMLINGVIDEIKEITSIIKLDKLPDTEYPLDENMDCLVVVALVDSVNNEPLQGWTVIDKDDGTIAGITMLGGVALMHYPWKAIDNDNKILKIYDPVDGKSVYTLEIKPKQSRILEVVLEIPFPQDSENKTENTKDTTSLDGNIVGTTDNRKDGLCKVLPRTSGQVLIFPTPRETGDGIQEPEESLHSRYSEEEAPAQDTRTETDDEKRISFLRKRRGFTYTKLFYFNVVQKLIVIRKPSIFKSYQKRIEDFYNTYEYRNTWMLFNFFFDSLLEVDELLLDASILRDDDLFAERNGPSLVNYAVILATEDLESYYSKGNLVADRVKIDAALDKIMAGHTQVFPDFSIKD